MDAVIEYGFQKILLFDADPVAVSVDDDWSKAKSDGGELELAFKVKMGSFNVIATVATIPTIFGVFCRVNTVMSEKATQAATMIVDAGLPPRSTSADKARDAVSAVASKLASAPESSGPDSKLRIRNALGQSFPCCPCCKGAH